MSRKNKSKRIHPNLDIRRVYKQGDSYVFSCPLNFSMYRRDHYESSVQFVNSLDQIIENNYKKVIINFLNCRTIRATTMILLYAKLETILQNCDVEIIIHKSIQREVNALIELSGLPYLCKHRCSENDIKKAKKHFSILNGSVDNIRHKIVDFIRDEIYQGNLSDNAEYLYGDAVNEAINNIYRHAYPKGTPTKSQLWWCMCSVLQNNLYLLLYDKGIGIPSTFSRGNELFEQIDWSSESISLLLDDFRKQFKFSNEIDIIDLVQSSEFNSDSSKITIAMSDDLTRMNGKDELKHGQGSKSIKKLVSENENSMLFIYSNRGLFIFKDDKTLPERYDMYNSINGTLVQWNIRIEND